MIYIIHQRLNTKNWSHRNDTDEIRSGSNNTKRRLASRDSGLTRGGHLLRCGVPYLAVCATSATQTTFGCVLLSVSLSPNRLSPIRQHDDERFTVKKNAVKEKQ